MEKSYILKFDQTKGDYVIVENKTPAQTQKRKGLFEIFNGNFFRRQREENQLKNGLLQIDKSQNNQNLQNFDQKTVKNDEKLNNFDKNQNWNIHNAQNLRANSGEQRQNDVTPNDVARPTAPETPTQPTLPNQSTPNQSTQPNQSSPTQPTTPAQPTTPPQPAAPAQPTVPNRPMTPRNDQNTPILPTTPNNFVPTPQNSLSVADSLPLIASLYAKFRILNMIYQNLVSINDDFLQGFNDFININNSLQSGLLNIYTLLARTNRIPQTSDRMPALPSSADGILQILANQIVDMRQINYQLINLFEVEEIDRQLALIDTALSIQFDQVTNFRLQN